MRGEPFGLVGLGGYGGYVGRYLIERMSDESKPLRLAAAYDPAPAQYPELVASLTARGVKMCDTYEQLLAAVHSLWLPVPIDLHRPMTEQALAAGKPVLCEKPAAGCVQDIDAMIRARDDSKLPVAIGFQDIYAESTQSLKQQIVDGAFGRISGATLHAQWPRNSAYFQRPWAGKMQRNGVWILDSPANNALAHFIHLALYLLGPQRAQNATPISVEAELYRVNPIENYDTCCMRVLIETGQQILICLTHASFEHQDPILQLDGASGDRVTYDYGKKVAGVRWGGVEIPMTLTPNSYEETLSGFEALLEGRPGPVATLEMARTHGLVVSGASEAAVVHTIGPPHRQDTPKDDGTILRHVPRIGELFKQAVSRKKMLHETGLASWTRPAGKIDLRNYRDFKGPGRAAATDGTLGLL